MFRAFGPSGTRAARWPIDLKQDPYLHQSFDVQRGKWNEVPYDMKRVRSDDLLRKSEAELVGFWNAAFPDEERDWNNIM
jgi:hypothetical protein